MNGEEASLASNSDSEDAPFGTTYAISAAKLRKSRPPVLGLMVLSQSSLACDACCTSPSSSEEREPFGYPETDAMTSPRTPHDVTPSSEVSRCALDGADGGDTRDVDDIVPRTLHARAVEMQSGRPAPFEGSVTTGTLAESPFKSHDNLFGSERLCLSSHPPSDPWVHDESDLATDSQERVDDDEMEACRPLTEYGIAFRPFESFGISARQPSNHYFEHAAYPEQEPSSPAHRLDVDLTPPQAHGDDVPINPLRVQERADCQESNSTCSELGRLRASSNGQRGLAFQQHKQHQQTQHNVDNENEGAAQIQTVGSLPTKRIYVPNPPAGAASTRQRKVGRRENVVATGSDVLKDLTVSSVAAQSQILPEVVVDSNSSPASGSPAQRVDTKALAVHRFSIEDAPMNSFSSHVVAEGRTVIAPFGEFCQPKASSIGRCGEAGRLHQQKQNAQQMSPSNQRFYDANKENDDATQNKIVGSVPKKRRVKPNPLVCAASSRQRKDGLCEDPGTTSVDVIKDLVASPVDTQNYTCVAVPNEDSWIPTSGLNLRHTLQDRLTETSAQSKLGGHKKVTHAFAGVRESKDSSKHSTRTVLSIADTSEPGIASQFDVRRRRCSWLPRHLAAPITSKRPPTASAKGGVAQAGEHEMAKLLGDAAMDCTSKMNAIGNADEAQFPSRFVGGDPSTPEVTPEQTEIVRRRRCSWLPRHLAAATSKSIVESNDIAGLVSASRNVRQQVRNLASKPADGSLRRRRCSWLPRHMCSALSTAMQPTIAQKLKFGFSEAPLVEHKSKVYLQKDAIRCRPVKSEPSKLSQKVPKSPSNGKPRARRGNQSNFENMDFYPAAGLSSIDTQKQAAKRNAQASARTNSKSAMPTAESKRRRACPTKF